MLHPTVALIVLLLPGVANSQTPPAPPDSPVTQALLTEIRQLRQDLQFTASTIQRVQIAMFRLQAESTVLNAATQRADNVRERCEQVRTQRKGIAMQIEQDVARMRDSGNPVAQKTAEQQAVWLKTTSDELATAEGECAASQVEVENQLRAEQAKMSDLQDQLDKLDKSLAGAKGK
jgi:uncharacterized phage infection (PIP) family protein YhgE